MKKRFLFGFLMMAMIMLLSGMIQSSNAVERSTPLYALDNSPPNIQPLVLTVTEVSQSVIVTWICTSMPGVQPGTSYMNDIIVYEDMPSMKCNLYYTINKIDLILHTNTGYQRDILKYPLDVFGVRKS